MAEDQILIFDLRASNQILHRIKSEQDPEEDISMQSSEAKTVSQRFSGFNWCLNRENLIATYSKSSSLVRFWDLPNESEDAYKQVDKIEKSE